MAVTSGGRSSKRKVYICPECGSDQLTHEKIYEIHTDLNTGEVLFDDTLTDQYEIKCRNCHYVTGIMEHLDEDIIVKDDQGKIIWRKKGPSKSITPEYELIVDFELNLRDIITKCLEDRFTEKWWMQIPKDVREKAQIRKQQEDEGSSLRKEGLPLIHYIDFSDYARIITKRDNWSTIFKKRFKNKEKINVYLNDLNNIRNAIMHARDLSDRKKMDLDYLIDKFKEIFRDFAKAI